jgi:hypothetical protein
MAYWALMLLVKRLARYATFDFYTTSTREHPTKSTWCKFWASYVLGIQYL